MNPINHDAKIHNLRKLKSKYTRLRHEQENALEVFSEFLRETGHEESFEKQYFNSRIQEIRIQKKNVELQYKIAGGDISALD